MRNEVFLLNHYSGQALKLECHAILSVIIFFINLYISLFFEQINRANGLEKQILSGKIYGTKSRDRQPTKYTDILNNFITRKLIISEP